ncbi:complement factor H-related protein 1-like [Gymnodraco acuticeps]|uniref:Complement factor H-related protein 1-like n=1 Tax=Gymnodraco acuticeps TaxID=8218 RepID=A0A6P8VRB1_GYMAC|nr:complement factor H-related protein 1-like [Gymnodraco acuticeps]
MTYVYFLGFFILCLKMDTSLQQEEIICTAPEIENGEVLEEIQEYKEHQVLEFQCDPSFTPADARSPKCTKHGVRAEWSPTPLCEPITCKLPGLKGTSYEPAYRNTFLAGEQVTVNCGNNHWIFSHQQVSVVTTCKEDGEWTITPECQEVTCSKRGVPHVSWDSRWQLTLKSGEMTRYGCARGYRRKDDRNDMATCTRDGWHPNPLCQALSCELPPADGGFIVKGIPENDDSILPDRFLEFSCDGPWKYLNGSSRLICLKDGQWDNAFPTCEALSGCGRPTPLEDGDIEGTVGHRNRHGDRVKYICPNYYKMQGDPHKTCTNGEWIGQMRCLKPCTVNSQDMTTHHIDFRHVQQNKLYSKPDDTIEFRCTSGRHDGAVDMRQKCNDGVILLPTCH